MSYPVAEGVRAGAIPFATPCMFFLEEVLSFFIKPIIVERGIDIKLDRVIPGCDCFDIPLYVVELLILSYVVEVV